MQVARILKDEVGLGPPFVPTAHAILPATAIARPSNHARSPISAKILRGFDEDDGITPSIGTRLQQQRRVENHHACLAFLPNQCQPLLSFRLALADAKDPPIFSWLRSLSRNCQTLVERSNCDRPKPSCFNAEGPNSWQSECWISDNSIKR